MDYCQSIVTYSRSRLIGNEAQCLALTLSMLSAYAPTPKEYASVGVLGELASGKTRLIKTVLGEYRENDDEVVEFRGILPADHIYHITSASSKAPIYSDDLRDSRSPIRIIEAAEYQKLGPDIIEYLKSQSGDDGRFVYEFTNMATHGTERITQKKRVIVFSYAQMSMDMELASRLIRFSVEENKHINQCVNRMTHGAATATYKGYNYTLAGNPELEEDLRDQVEMLSGKKPIEVVNPFFDALTDLEDSSRASSKRTSALIEALFKSSARINFSERKKTANGEVIMSAQDLVNVLSLTDIVQSMVLEIDNIDLAIIRFLGMRDNRSADQTYIINHLRKSGLAELKLKEFTRRAEELENGNYLVKWWDAEGKKWWWKLNEDKYIHPLTVTWKAAFAVDPSPVINPITGEYFVNIIEFGKQFDAQIRRGLELNMYVDPDKEITFEENVLRSVQRLLTGSRRYKEDDLVKLRTDCMSALGQTSLCDHERFTDAIKQMMDDRIIDVDPQTKTLVLLDPSVSAGMATRSGKRKKR